MDEVFIVRADFVDDPGEVLGAFLTLQDAEAAKVKWSEEERSLRSHTLSVDAVPVCPAAPHWRWDA